MQINILLSFSGMQSTFLMIKEYIALEIIFCKLFIKPNKGIT